MEDRYGELIRGGVRLLSSSGVFRNGDVLLGLSVLLLWEKVKQEEKSRLWFIFL